MLLYIQSMAISSSVALYLRRLASFDGIACSKLGPTVGALWLRVPNLKVGVPCISLSYFS